MRFRGSTGIHSALDNHLSGWGAGVWFPNGTDVHVKNNLWYDCSGYVYDGDPANVRVAASSMDNDYNLYIDSPLTGTTPGSNSVQQTGVGVPFVDGLETGDVTPNETGTMIGETLGGDYSFDMYGTLRTTWNVGAVEPGEDTPVGKYLMCLH